MANPENRILAADDDLSDRYLLKKAFDETDPEVEIIFSGNGEELITQVKELFSRDHKLPRLILLDLNMPKLNGIETLKIIKNDPIFKLIPVLILSISDSDAEVFEAYKHGANSFIKKPVTYEGLLEFIKSIDKYWFKTATIPKI